MKITEFPRFIVIESLERTPLAKLSSILIEKVISSWVNLQTMKKFEMAIDL